jgi:hypothetical protein
MACASRVDTMVSRRVLQGAYTLYSLQEVCAGFAVPRVKFRAIRGAMRD